MTSSICARGAGDQVQVAGRARRRAGQGDVDRGPRRGCASSSAASSSRGARLEQRLERLAGLVGAALPTGPRSSAGSSAIPRRIVGQLGLAAEVADPQLLELGGAAGAASIAASASAAHLLDPLKHQSAASRMAGDDIRSQRDRRRRGDVERLGAAGAQRDRHLRLAGARAPRPAGPRARRRGRASRRRASAVEARRRRGRRAPPAAPGVASIPARAGGWAKIAPMLARTAFGEKGSAQPGPSTTEPPSSACAVRTIAPTLPGSPTPCR